MLKFGRRIAVVAAGTVSLAVPAIVLLPTAVATAQAADIAAVTCDPVASTQPTDDPELLSFDPQRAERIVDTRDGNGGVDAPLDAGCTLMIDMSDVGPEEVSAFALSVTVISSTEGFFTAFPCAGGQPGTSSVNARPGIPTPNLVVGVPDADGMLCLFSERGGNVVIDVSGWWANGPNQFTPIEPTRAFDSRVDQPTKLPADAVASIQIADEVVPDDAVSITLNLAAVGPESKGFLVAYPCGSPVPLASNINFVEGEKRAVSAIVELPTGDNVAKGKLCISGNATTHFLIDVTGYDAPSARTSPDLALQPVADTRIVDTRIPDVAGIRFEPRTVQRFDLSSVIERPDDAVAVVLNAVVTRADVASFLSISPCSGGTPTTSSLNYNLNQTANLVVTALTPDTKFCVFADTAVDVVIDLVGVYTGPEGSLVNQLSLSEPDGTLVPLDQDFDVEASDATLTCDGDRDLRLRLGVAPEVTASVNGVTVAPRDPVVPDLAIPLAEDGLLTVEVQRGSETAEYFVRCLPSDFPDLQVEIADGASPGWYLTDLGSSDPDLGPFLVIMNERGVPVWYQRLDERLIDAKLLSTGDLVAAANPPGFTADPSLGHRVISLDGTLVDKQLTDSDLYPADKHDYIEIPALSKGRAIISYPLVENVDLSNLDPAAIAGTAGPFKCPNSESNTVIAPDQKIADGSIRELTSDGSDAGTAPDLEWEWNMSDHFSIEEVSVPLCFGNYVDAGVADNPGEVDVFHINSLDRVDEPGCEPECDYLVSARHLDSVIRVDRSVRDPDGSAGPLAESDGYVEWILSSQQTPPVDGSGDPAPNVFGEARFDAPRLNIVGDPLGGPLRMHDARLDGDILTMHDNRTFSGEPSRFVEYRIDTTDVDPANWTATWIRQIDAPFDLTSGALGSAQITDDGSVLMGWGTLQPMFVEYDADDNVVLQASLSVGQVAYRIVKYTLDAFDADELRATAGSTTQAP